MPRSFYVVLPVVVRPNHEGALSEPYNYDTEIEIEVMAESREGAARKVAQALTLAARLILRPGNILDIEPTDEPQQQPGHDWKMVEPGPPGHDPPWGDWWSCPRCGAGTRSATPPPADKLVFEGTLTCEQYRQHPCCTLKRVQADSE